MVVCYDTLGVQLLSHVWLFAPMNCSTPGFPIFHHPLELAQTHVRWVSDAIQPSHPLSSPSPPAFNLSQHRGLFNESVLCIRWPKYWSFSISPSNRCSGLISLGLTGLISLKSKGLSRVFSNTTAQKHQFFGAQPSLWSNSHIHTWLLEKKTHNFDCMDLCSQRNVSALLYAV